MVSSSKTPTPPIFMPPPAAPTYVQPTNPEKIVPPVMSAEQITKEGLASEALLPEFLQLRKDPLDPTVLKQYEDNYFAQNVAPQIANAEAQVGANGQQYSSYGGGMIGQLKAQGQLDKFNAGLNASQQAYNNLLQGRQSLYSGGIGLAQDQSNLNVQRGLGIAGLSSQNTQAENQFNSNIYGLGSQNSNYMNSFNQQNYQNSLQAIAMKNQQKANTAYGIGSFGLGALQLGSSLFGGGGGGAIGGGGGGAGAGIAGNAIGGAIRGLL